MIATARNDIKEAKLFVTIIRNDGSTEEIGEVAYHHKNPIKRLIWKVKKFFGIV